MLKDSRKILSKSFEIEEEKFQKTEATYYNEVIKIKFFELIQREQGYEIQLYADP